MVCPAAFASPRCRYPPKFEAVKSVAIERYNRARCLPHGTKKKNASRRTGYSRCQWPDELASRTALQLQTADQLRQSPRYRLKEKCDQPALHELPLRLSTRSSACPPYFVYSSQEHALTRCARESGQKFSSAWISLNRRLGSNRAALSQVQYQSCPCTRRSELTEFDYSRMTPRCHRAA